MKKIRDSESDDLDAVKKRLKNKFRHPKFWDKKYATYDEFVANDKYFQTKDKNN